VPFQVCFGDGAYCISSDCKDRHFFCGDCIRGTLTAIIEMGQFPAICPACRANDPNGHDASKRIDYGRIDEEALSFLQIRGVISSSTLFRFVKAAALSAGPNDAASKAVAEYEACPAGCGQYLLKEHESYTASMYESKLGEIMTIRFKATSGSGVVHNKCFSPGCAFKAHTNKQDWKCEMRGSRPQPCSATLAHVHVHAMFVFAVDTAAFAAARV
jgi:hypothetical protein